MDPVRELYTSALGAKMFMGVGRNSTEEIMFLLSYKQLVQSRVWGKTFLESRIAFVEAHSEKHRAWGQNLSRGFWFFIRWTWVWVNSGRWWWTGRLGVLRFMRSQRVGRDWATELNWTTNNTDHLSIYLFPYHIALW